MRSTCTVSGARRNEPCPHIFDDTQSTQTHLLTGPPTPMKLSVQLSALLFCLTGMEATAIPDVDLHHIVRLQGHGALTVILESGLGDTMDVWKDIQPRIAAGCTRTLAYNRAGYLGSDPATGPRDSRTIVAELRAELKRRNIEPPYILVGHSLANRCTPVRKPKAFQQSYFRAPARLQERHPRRGPFPPTCKTR
jgi:pimeloyl-ACP methyl ester carboxylesterase